MVLDYWCILSNIPSKNWAGNPLDPNASMSIKKSYTSIIMKKNDPVHATCAPLK
jgi:hypothetical protein